MLSDLNSLFIVFMYLVKHFNYSWPDMTSPSIGLMRDIVTVACNEINQGGKVRVWVFVCISSHWVHKYRKDQFLSLLRAVLFAYYHELVAL